MYAIDNKLKVNKRRLSKKDVKVEISKGADLRVEFCELFSAATSSGRHKLNPKVYELKTGDYLYVFDEHDAGIAGKGDIYCSEIFERIIKKYRRSFNDRSKSVGNSVSMWRYFTKVGNEVINNIEFFRTELACKLHILEEKLDFTYKSLDLLNEKLINYEIEEIRLKYYDELLAYIGEVLRLRVQGEWKLNIENSQDDYPYIDIGSERCKIMPLNVLLTEFSKIKELNLRQATANEVRANSNYISKKK